ncbi:HTH-type transcriptional regulator McbR [compost metagenome]|uniref:GntR family transcriptional regulator n=1 Tax=Achromobacter spanius TaxID=217203 RepID=A0ABY8GY03_9BURK|nr:MULTISPECIES: GntR family transcriptional regulator [Achromobacter]MCS3505194.1 DNA-binding GntR family transcriptional regulator [Achromobacter sp. JUb104]WAI81000.1 GntR family transcriptional regulator [Achromobacter spanius]WEX96518.1 GntR family transcriptional regulator [Achromobacter sp. SS2-2022]WFP09765.1 GntR family transcriptional regulator [Achromobacter spanius]
MEYRTKEEQVADYLRERIISGVFPRGSRLKQAEIAEQLKLSITPVREALKLLEAEGYISGDSYRGARVVPFDAGASAEILQLRLLLESQLVRAAVERITTQDITELRVLANDFAKAFETGDRAIARGINYRFHRQLYDIAQLPQTLHFVQILWARYPFDLINSASNRGQDAVREHEEILQAFASGDASAAMLAMRKHIESGWTVLKSLSEPGG